jgi:hypothetical protein
MRWRCTRACSGYGIVFATDPVSDSNLALALLQHFEKFFAFLRHEGVEPTNNIAERALRCAVQWRKISFGSRRAQATSLSRLSR